MTIHNNGGTYNPDDPIDGGEGNDNPYLYPEIVNLSVIGDGEVPDTIQVYFNIRMATYRGCVCPEKQWVVILPNGQTYAPYHAEWSFNEKILILSDFRGCSYTGTDVTNVLIYVDSDIYTRLESFWNVELPCNTTRHL